MSSLLQDKINSFRRNEEKRRLIIENDKFFDEIITTELYFPLTFKTSNLTNLKFQNVNFEGSLFLDCVLKNCIFNSAFLDNAQFFNCTLLNCQIINSSLTDATFMETTFEKCCFEKAEKSSLVKAWFESCHFIETNFNGFDIIPLIQTAIVDSKFSKFNKSIEFKGEFFLCDLLLTSQGIDQMFHES